MSAALSIAKSLKSETLAKDSINYFIANSSDYDTFLDYDLPAPSYLVPTDSGYYIGWLINGSISSQENRKKRFINTSSHIHSKKARDFLFDISQKIAKALKAKIQLTVPKFKIKNQYSTFTRYELSDLNTTDIQAIKLYNAKLKTRYAGNDALFDIIRAKAYQLKREATLTRDGLSNYAHSVSSSLMIKNKSFSDIESKVKSIFNWTDRFYNPSSTSRVSSMSRYEASAHARNKRVLYIKKRVNNYLSSLVTLNTDLSKVSVSYISQSLSISWRTARIYLAAFQELTRAKSLLKASEPLIVQLKVIATETFRELLKKTFWMTEFEYIEYVELRNNGFRDVPF